MKRTRTISMFLALVALISVSLWAGGLQVGSAFGTGFSSDQEVTVDIQVEDSSGGCCRVIPPRRILKHVLQLDEDQLAKVAELARQIAEAVGPLAEEIRQLKADLKEELGSNDPEPCVVGELVISIKNLREEICRTRNSFADDFLAILTPEQAERWLAIKHRFCRPHKDGTDPAVDNRS